MYCTIFIYLLVSFLNNSIIVIFNSECVKWAKSGLIILVELDIEVVTAAAE